MSREFSFETLQLHAGQTPDKETKSRAVPIYQTTSYVFDDAQEGEDLFALRKPGNIYTRITNPTVAVLEERIAALEGGVGALATASGMAAITYAILGLAHAGDHVVAATTLYGGTFNLLKETLPRYGITTTFVDVDNPEEIEAAIKDNTKLVLIESLGNPLINIPDFEKIAEIAHSHKIPLVADNTFGTPYLINVISHGVDYVSVFGVLYFLEMYLKEETEENSVNSRELITVIIITAAVFVVSNISYLDQGTLFSSRFAGEMFTIRTLVDLSGMAVLYAYHIQMRELQMKFEVDTLQNILEMQYKNYQLSQESIEIVNQKYHDLKHQITLLKAEANSEKSTQYLEQMEKEIKSYEAQNKTGNKVLDAVLTSKSLYCQNKGIVFTCVADGTLLNFMAEMDISALFGNILDNAIEGAEKIPEKEKRLIHLSVAEQKSFLRIRVENYCEEKIVFKNGIPQTTKKDKRFHGFGMKSIQSTVKKYGGSVTAGVRDNWFELRILIPLHVV